MSLSRRARAQRHCRSRSRPPGAAHPHPARRTLGGLLRPRSGQGVGSSIGVDLHLRHRCGELSARRRRGQPRLRPDDRVHRRPPTGAARLGCRPDDRPGRHVHHQCPLGCRSARSVRLVGAGCPPGRHPGLRVVRGRRPRPCPPQLAASQAPRTGRWRTGSRVPTPDDRLSFASAPTTDRLGELGGTSEA